MNKEFALIGASRTGVALAYHLVKKGYKPVLCWNRSAEKYTVVKRYVEFEKFLDSPEEARVFPGMVVIAVADDAIGKVASEIARSWEKLEGIIAFHISGALSSDVLSPLAERGANTGSFHPFVSIPDIETGIERIPGTIFTCEGKIAGLLRDIAKEIGRGGVVVTGKQKAVLHVSAVFLSNYVVTMISEIGEFLEKEGIRKSDVEGLFLPMIEEAGRTALEREFPEAITGPIVRNDRETIRKHLQILNENKRLKELYMVFGRLTCEKVIEAGGECRLQDLFEVIEGNL